LNLQIRPHLDPVIDFIPVSRTHPDGELVESCLMVSWCAPDLTIGAEWGTAGKGANPMSSYEVEETEADWTGRIFRLTRDPLDVARSEDKAADYSVYVGPLRMDCNCASYLSDGQPCRHVNALRYLLQEGYL
jgi:hypothetical protein